MTFVSVAIVVPVRNEENILWDNVSVLATLFDRLIGKQQWKFIFVNNASTDNSHSILEKIKSTWLLSKILFEERKGYSYAIKAGLKEVDTPFAFIIDVEQWDIPYIVWAWEHREEYDLLIGSKRLEPVFNRQTWKRRFLSWGLNKILQLCFQYPGTETHGQKLIHIQHIKPILESCKMEVSLYDTELVLRMGRNGHPIAEAAVPFREVRGPRNGMLEKFTRNVVGIIKLYRLMSKIPSQTTVRHDRFSRCCVMSEYNTFIKKSAEILGKKNAYE